MCDRRGVYVKLDSGKGAVRNHSIVGQALRLPAVERPGLSWQAAERIESGNPQD